MIQKVLVPNRGGHDYSAAEQFGELVFVTTGHINRFATGKIYRECMTAVQDSSPDDYIMEVGPSICVTILAACFARQWGRLNLLIFSDGEYMPRELNIDSLMEV